MKYVNSLLFPIWNLYGTPPLRKAHGQLVRHVLATYEAQIYDIFPFCKQPGFKCTKRGYLRLQIATTLHCVIILCFESGVAPINTAICRQSPSLACHSVALVQRETKHFSAKGISKKTYFCWYAIACYFSQLQPWRQFQQIWQHCLIKLKIVQFTLSL